MVDKGQEAPDFNAPLADGEEIEDFSLGDEVGGNAIVLAFFPGAFTSVCTEEMCNIRDSLTDFEELDAQVYGISVDTPFALNEFIEKHSLNFPLVSDFEKEIIEKYDVVYEDLGGITVAERSVFVINTNGVVSYRWVGDNPGVLPELEEVKDAVREVST